jgi:hypothetical protein
VPKIGCTGWFILLIILAGVVSLFKSQPWTIFVGLALLGWGVYAIFRARDRNQKAFSNGLLAQAAGLEFWAANGSSNEANFDMAKGEKFISQLTGIQLAEYTSTGSTYSGGNVGVSVPVFGRVRANVGRSQGSLTRNPAELHVIDTGTVAFTSERVIFIGSQQTRVWTFSKIVNQTLGPNGISISISVANKSTTSTLIQPIPTLIGPGLIYGVAYDAHKEGDAEARKTALLYAKQLRDGVAGKLT